MIRKILTALIGGVVFLSACSFKIFNIPVGSNTPAPLIAETPSLAATSSPTTLPLPTSTSPAAVEPTQPLATHTQTSPTQPENQPGATSLPDPAGFRWAEVLTGFSRPLLVLGARDGSNRLFIVSQEGQIFITRDGQLLTQPFLDISDRTTRPGAGGSLGERGLLGLAFHPDFAQNGYFYVNYTDQNDDTHISRFSVNPDDPDQADPNSEEQLLFQDQPYPNHNGGALAFGPDGYLYIGLGDGGSGGDPLGNGQSLQTWLGKILRLDVDHDQPYAIPQDNPFASGGGLGEIWAYGLRNPWRIAFDRLTGDLYIADVGQNAYEEVNFQPAGSTGGINYGWNYREGLHGFEGTPPEGLDLVDPVAEYSHEFGCSVTGGVVYRGSNLPEWQGVYLYGDYCSGRIWGLHHTADGSWQNSELFQSGFTVSSFGEDDAGEVYVLDYSGGSLYRLESQP